MDLKSVLKKRAKRMVRFYRAIRTNYYNAMYSDESYLKHQYKKIHGVYPDLEHPRNLSEKLIWLMLNYRDERMEMCSDKFAVRDYYQEVLQTDKYLIPCLGCYDHVNDIDFDKLPNRFVLKATHGSGWNYICTDKSKLTKKQKRIILSDCNYWLTHNLARYGREWNYRNIKPRIICEAFIGSDNGEAPFDYKFFCFNGEPKMIQVDADRFIDHKRNFYDIHWNLLNATDQLVNKHITDRQPEPPRDLDEMLSIARRISSNFPHVRVDLYNVSGRIYCGEMTFFHDAGLSRFEPESFHEELGSWLTLPR
jgi:hypothetical protein